MTPELLFSIVNPLAASSWILLAALPRHDWVTRLVTNLIVPALLATV